MNRYQIIGIIYIHIAMNETDRQTDRHRQRETETETDAGRQTDRQQRQTYRKGEFLC